MRRMAASAGETERTVEIAETIVETAETIRMGAETIVETADRSMTMTKMNESSEETRIGTETGIEMTHRAEPLGSGRVAILLMQLAPPI
jgi:hypothetical protein